MSASPIPNAKDEQLATDLVMAFIDLGKVKPVLPVGRRGEVIELLTRLMAARDFFEAYVAALEAELEHREVRLLLLESGGAGLDIPDEQIAREGFGGLTDDQLADIAISPEALHAIRDYLDDPEAVEGEGEWLIKEVIKVEAARPDDAENAERANRVYHGLRDAGLLVINRAGTIPFQANKQQNQHRLARWLWPSLALAASVLFAFFLGTQMRPAGSFSANRPMEVLAASVTTQFDPGRGAGDGLRIRVQAGRPGFATVISLATARAQEIFPEPGSADIRLDETMASTDVPIPSDSKSAIVVITETQSTGHIRKALTGKNYMANDDVQLQRDLCKALSEQGYTWAFVGISQINQPAKP